MQIAETQLCLQHSIVLPGAEATQRPKQWSFLRVCAGSGYLLGEHHSEALEAGDLVCTPAGGKVCVRASHLARMTLCQFGVCPAELPGLFTLAEQRILAKAARVQCAPWVVSGKDPLARHFTEICDSRATGSALALRGELLRLATRALSGVAKPEAAEPDNHRDARQRFGELMSRVSAKELASRTPADLARECGCGLRHFRRLFRDYAGVSFQTHQIQSRLGTAKQLLRDTRIKVIEVAGECGFRNLGHFNATFKRLVGVTPSAWRQSAALDRSTDRPRPSTPCPPSPGGSGAASVIRNDARGG